MNAFLSIPLELRLVLLAALGALAGSAVNLAAAWLTRPRPILHPWVCTVGGSPLRQAVARLPILGWIFLRRSGAAAGVRPPGIRPLVVELLTAAGFAGLYWWEIERLGLLPPPLAWAAPADWLLAAHQQYAAHLVLGVLMLAASLIDMDEKIIPDAITVPGALLGLLIAALLPHSLLPTAVLSVDGAAIFDNLQVASPQAWPNLLSGSPETLGLMCGVGCFAAWCAALLPRTWYGRHGWLRAAGLCCARLKRDPATRWILLMLLLGSPAIYAVWRLGGEAWRGLLCALVGMAVSGGLIWVVRVIGYLTLRREAMGFGDVTLMAMIGAFLGWQPSLMVFFIAPFAGLLVGILQLVMHRDNEIPYGPFLCLAALVAIVRWAPLWRFSADIFALGSFVPVILAACMALMAVLLLAMRLVRSLF